MYFIFFFFLKKKKSLSNYSQFLCWCDKKQVNSLKESYIRVSIVTKVSAPNYYTQPRHLNSFSLVLSGKSSEHFYLKKGTVSSFRRPKSTEVNKSSCELTLYLENLWLLLCQKTKGLWFYVLMESPVHNLSYFLT